MRRPMVGARMRKLTHYTRAEKLLIEKAEARFLLENGCEATFLDKLPGLEGRRCFRLRNTPPSGLFEGHVHKKSGRPARGSKGAR